MKRLEEIFDKTFSDYNKRVSHVYAFKFTDSERKMFLEMIQDYAREVAQASLQKAAENSILKLTFSSGEIATNPTWKMPDGELIELQKESITNESNITLL
ncbi:hypothetical protein [Elizabethkingia meningoseptica]|uniref:hypothetical protein n=1 Tax=Elizabethkingia meningoseptica TaxID=238 RepID=UPI001624D3D2|nr:hypothetical protein [Elizabethkingia meningoseptica]